MIGSLISKIVGTKNERDLKRIQPVVSKINSLETGISSLSDEALRAKTTEFRERLSRGQTLDDLLPEAFAVVREASKRVLIMRHFDVQLVGGVALHEGRIAEMKTGEGKTLVATLPVYLNALEGRGVHVVTVNDYLAQRDAGWMGRLYSFLGLSTGVIIHGLTDEQRQRSYGADITYGTNNEFGFDYLRDNMKYGLADYVQRELNYAIVDEVDSILVDEARTPLIISGPSEESTGTYYTVDRLIPKLKKDTHFTVEEKHKSAALTEAGVAKVEEMLGVENLYDPKNMDMVHYVVKGLIAHTMYKRDVEYVVKDDEVIIVDEFTGRLMPGRRWSDGLHQAIEAKEGVKIANENQTLATITFQNYFRMYNKLAGMTGTASTEAAEFENIYKLEVNTIPTNLPMIRRDNPDLIYRTEKGKFEAVIKDIEDAHRRGQPALVGTISIEKSERLSAILKAKRIPHSVLNAKHHEREAEIVMQAGRKGAVTIATNMAGRGTDIILGGNPDGMARQVLRSMENQTEEDVRAVRERFEAQCRAEKQEVLSAGGLHIIGTERHESRRIDNQLRGRSGRQGDPGSSRFYLSLEDDLMRVFGSEKIMGMMDKLGMDDSTPIEHRMVSKAIENAQKKVEEHHFSARKHLLEYDDVMNKQRTEIYRYRREILQGDGLREKAREMTEGIALSILAEACPEDSYPDQWDLKGLADAVFGQFGVQMEIGLPKDRRALEEHVLTTLESLYNAKEAELGSDLMRYLEKMIMLQTIDSQWKDHLLGIDHLKEGIGLRGYAQKDPLVEYKREAFDMFDSLGDRIEAEIMGKLFRVQVAREMPAEPPPVVRPQKVLYNKSDSADGPAMSVRRSEKKVGRNDPCPCGSGRKYKKCCGINA